MRIIAGLAALLFFWASPAAAQPSQEQIQAFGGRAMSLMLAIEGARRCPGLDAVERAVADKLWEIDGAQLKRIVPTIDTQVTALRQQYAGKPCADAQFIAARKNGLDYAVAITSVIARLMSELPECKPIPYFANAKPWAAARKTPAEMETAVAGLAGGMRPQFQASCSRDFGADPILETIVKAEAATRDWAKYGFGACVPVGAFLLSDPVCAWKAPVADGIVAGKLCNLGSGSFDREDCVFGFDAAGNLMLSYAMKTDSGLNDAIDRVGFAIGDQRFDTTQTGDAPGARRTWRFPPAAAKALLEAPRDAKLDPEAFIGDFKIDSNTPHPAADWQDAVELTKALRG
jgi:hypothetical protein